MKNQWKGFACGVLVTLLLVGSVGTAVATVGKKSVEISYNNIGVTLDGKAVSLVDVNGDSVEPFMLNNTNYLPVRAVAQALGLNVDWDGATKTVILTTPESENDGSIVGITGTLKAQNFDFTIEYAKIAKTIKTEAGISYNAGNGKTFLLIMFKAKNTSDGTKNVMYSGFNSYVDGEKVTQNPVVGKIDGNYPLGGAVSAGMTFTGYSVWEIPEDWEAFQFSYLDAGTGEESKQSFKIFKADIDG